MRDAWLLFPHGLFERVERDAAGMEVRLVEPALFFEQFPFHRQKLFLHRVSMARFAARLSGSPRPSGRVRRGEEQEGASFDRWRSSPSGEGAGGEGSGTFRDVRHLRIEDCPTLDDALDGIEGRVHAYEILDDWLERDLRAACARRGLELVLHEGPGFLTPLAELEGYAQGFGSPRSPSLQRRQEPLAEAEASGYGDPRDGRLFQHDFYLWQRRRMGLLLDEAGGPLGGRWSHDAENRHALPASTGTPMTMAYPQPPELVAEARAWLEARYPGNPGELHPDRYPTTHEEARAQLAWFVDFALPLFGPYQDAMRRDESFLFHSALSPALNAGLITPGEVLEAVLAASDVPLATVEGFVRQLVGWREFMRLAYLRLGRAQRTRNALGHVKPLPAGFWDGTTGLKAVDGVVRRVLRTGYAHHIERLMVLAGAMLVLEVRPDEAYRWFMSLFVDAYDWVMVPNVYGMGLFADGGLISTKPYFASSAYLTRMGDWPADPVVDALYWRFVSRHRALLLDNPRLCEAVRAWDATPRARKEALGRALRDWSARYS